MDFIRKLGGGVSRNMGNNSAVIDDKDGEGLQEKVGNHHLCEKKKKK